MTVCPNLKECEDWQEKRRFDYVEDFKCRHKDFWTKCPIYKETLKSKEKTAPNRSANEQPTTS